MIGTAYHLALPPGTRIEEYEITSVLGQGSFGITYLAEDINLGANIAIKEYLPGDWAFRDSTQTVRPKSTNLSDSFERGQESFLKEARLLARVAHPNIVKVRRFFRAHGTAYIAMDFVQGKSLGDILNDDYPQGGYPSVALKRLLTAILGGLGALHEAGIVHRDIKPGNVVIELNGNPILVDFGAARNYDRTVAQGMTVIVTPGYAPIEQYSDDGEQGPFTDIYALGALAYRAIAGQPPDAPYKRLGRNTFVPASVAGAGRYPPAILEAIDWALAVQPQDRPQTAALLLERLRDAPDTLPAPADESTRIISDSDATQVLNPVAWRSRDLVEGRAEPSSVQPRPARETSIKPSSIGRPEATDETSVPSRKWLPLAAAAIAALVLIGGVGWFVWPRAPLDPVAASRIEEERAAEAARKAAAEAEAAHAEAERQAAARAEAERQAAEAAKAKATQEAAEAARREVERQAAAKAEADRQTAAKAEAERQAAEAAKAKAAQEAAEAARREAERQAAAKAEVEGQAAAKAEADRQAAAAAAKAKADQEAAEAARQEAAKQAAAKAAADRQAAVEAARQKAEAQKAAAKAEAERKAAAAEAAKKAKADQAKPITPSRVADTRCTDILQNAQLMGAISDEDKTYLRDHCH